MATVRDIMQTDVITIPPRASIRELIELLDRHGITGVPVVNETEALVGVVSMTDVLRLAREMADVPEAVRWGLGAAASEAPDTLAGHPLEGEFFAYYVTPTGGYVDVSDRIRTLPDDLFEGYKVEDIMTPAPYSIAPEAPVSELAASLLKWKVHRALVADSGQLRGIVTTTDILRVLAE